jgi:photosystem II stability/assembly factor-like uncharacterized protein
VSPVPVTAPPRSTDTHDDGDLAQRVADLEALIKEARRRARRRRQVFTAALLVGAGVVAGALFGIGGHGHGSVGDQVASGPPAAAAAARGPGRWGASLGPDGGAFTLALDPTNPRILYAAGFGDVYRSSNGGRSWKKGPAEPWRRVSALTVDATQPRVVYAGTDRGIAKTVDGGRSWRLLNRGLFDGETRYQRGHRLGEGFVSSLVLDPRDRQTVYAITDRGLFRTTSGGERWSIIGPALFRKRTCLHCNGRYYGYSLSAAIDPRNGTIYASWARGATFAFPDFLYTSTDRGRSWRSVRMHGSLRLETFTGLAIDSAGTLYALAGKDVPYLKQVPGVIKSTDGGRTWAAAGLSNRVVWQLQVDPGNGRTVYATTDSDLLASSDGGRSWREITSGPRPYGSVVSDPIDPRVVYGIGDGVVKSVDGGRSWLPSNNGLIASGIYTLVLAPGSGTILYQGDAKSVDGGRTWRHHRTGLGKASIGEVAVVPKLPRTLYAGSGSGLFKSTDAGASWQAVATGTRPLDVSRLAVDPGLPNTVYVAACGPGSACGDTGLVLKTVDGGTTWRRLTLPEFGPGRSVQAFAIDPNDPDVIFAGTSYWFSHPGLLRSTDGGSTWQPPLTAPSLRSYSADAIVFDPRNSDNVYAASSKAGILKSSDGGKTWAAANSGLTDKGIVALAIDPANPRILYASTGGVWTTMPARVFRSTDGARSWHSVSAGLPAVGVEVFAIDPSGRTVYAGTGGDGVIRLRTRR